MTTLRIILLFSVIASAHGEVPESCDSDFNHTEHTKLLAIENLKFTMELYKAVNNHAGRDSNILVSPLSLSQVLSMVFVGAHASTEEEFRDTLHLDKNKTNVNTAFQQILTSLKREERCNWENFTLAAANRMYVAKEYPIKTDFQNILEKYYLSEAVCTDFAAEPDKSRMEINKWVKEKTKDKITDLIPKRSVVASTVMLLINVVYFKGNWSRMFEYELTKDDVFRQETTPVNAKFMHASGNFLYGESELLECKVLELPYLGNRFSFFAILPNRVKGITKLESELTSDDLRILMKSVENQQTIIALPKFKIELGSEVGSILETMGITRCFTKDADLSGISKSDKLEVSKVLHKVCLEIDELGSEAAASTALAFESVSSTEERAIDIPEFIADHPFMFLIYDKKIDMVLFIGRLSMPVTI